MLRPSGKKLGRLEKKGRDDLRTDSRIAFGSIKTITIYINVLFKISTIGQLKLKQPLSKNRLV